MRRLLAVLVPVMLVVVGVAIVGATSSEPEPERLAGAGEHYAVTVVFDEASTGERDAEIVVRPKSADALWISTTMPEMGHATPEVRAREQAPGRFLAHGEFFTMTGVWEMAARVRGPTDTEVVTVDVLVTR